MRHQPPRTSIGGDGSPSPAIVPTRSSGSRLRRRRADSLALHHHLTDASAAAALSPLLKSKYKSNTGGGGRVSYGPGAGVIGTHLALLGHDEKKKEETDRDEKLAQLQQSDPGLEAADHTQTALRMKAQYASCGPRRVPNALRTGMDGVAVAAAVDSFYTAPFLQLACREAAEREVAARLRGYVKKMTSKLHTVRVEGLKEAMSQLLQWTTQASVESTERRREQQQQEEQEQRHVDAPYEQYPGALTLPPYDAVRVEVLGASSSPAAGAHHHHRAAALPSPRGGGGGGRAEEVRLARAANAARSPSWDVVQQALEGVDYTSAIFNAILIPRLEVRNAMSTGVPISIQLSSEMALQWTTLPTTRHPAPMPPAVTAAAAAAKDEASPGKDGPSTPPRPNELLQAATAITYEEQELALRYIQGACLTLYYQRRCCSEGCLVYYATEVFQCMRSHAEALFTWQRRELEDREQQQQQQNGGNKKKGNLGVTVVPQPTSTAVNTVAVDPGLIRVVVALVEAVEAACHYNPSCLRRLVQTGGVTAMLNLAYCPFMPTSVRSAVLSAISVLLQEVNPLRRYVAASSTPGEGGSLDRSADPLLQRMVENAMHDNPIGHHGRQIPYSTDRGSASKFDSAVRDWFFANGLGNVIPAVAQLQDLRSTFQSTSFMVPQGMTGASMGGVGGGASSGQGGGGGGPGGGTGGSAAGGGGGGGAVAPLAVANASANMSFASIIASARPSLHSPLTGRTFGGGGGSGGVGVVGGGPGNAVVGGGAGGAVAGGTAAAAAVAAATHANMQREGELYRKRVGRLLECMDGRELR
ncbi:hypothetical protein ABB37_06934 [Leptomonas pyrrhocoris]|uniref:Uncharacterized protein n=1 Tax=Leptomonas pyrrhocoris TaxID=157538 RepID=A0A0M9FWK2_LEPPY|nr:hypothetical protein ABB37_06934 [Leptomonas pyrrhocoris]KPA77560.1 hypothetical protein ABB37_06934 [Leptomonas pyrrhocoris]|eukprot:XP_015655999.1 hypothetical protein ABB37_06934 [Leptomonas pyrrhocoris]